MRRIFPALLLLLLIGACQPGADAPPRLLLGTTHTLEDSGLLDWLTTGFRAAHPEEQLQVVVAGSGEVLEYGKKGDVDVLVTHAPDAEQEFLRWGHIDDLRPVMHNDFVVLGPAADPAQIRDAADAVTAFRRLRDARARFISRGDDSGTHRKEKALWFSTGVMPDWKDYTEAGTGMAEVLRLASARQAYTLSDRATWLHVRAELQLELLFNGGDVLLNPYSVSRSRRARNIEGARKFADWVTSPAAQQLIRNYGRSNYGEPLFVPDVRAPQ